MELSFLIYHVINTARVFLIRVYLHLIMRVLEHSATINLLSTWFTLLRLFPPSTHHTDNILPSCSAISQLVFDHSISIIPFWSLHFRHKISINFTSITQTTYCHPYYLELTLTHIKAIAFLGSHHGYAGGCRDGEGKPKNDFKMKKSVLLETKRILICRLGDTCFNNRNYPGDGEIWGWRGLSTLVG